MHRKITRQSWWNLRRASDRAIPNQAPGMVGEGVETGWRAPLAGEGTVRLSSKGESDLQPERDRLCHSGRLRSFRAPTGRLLTTRYAISSSNSIQRSSVFILAFRNKKLVQRVLNTGAKIVSSATSVD